MPLVTSWGGGVGVVSLLFHVRILQQIKFKSVAEFLALLKPFLEEAAEGYKLQSRFRNKKLARSRFVDLHARARPSLWR